jgi:hypothetical protein
MGDAGQQDLVEVAQDGGERLALLGRVGGQPCPDLAGDDRSEDGERLDALEVVGRPAQGGLAVGEQVGAGGAAASPRLLRLPRLTHAATVAGPNS